MERCRGSYSAWVLILVLLMWAAPAQAQQSSDSLQVPPQFKLDMEVAARLRPQLMAQSVPAAARYALGQLVLKRLAEQARAGTRFAWQLRIVEDHELNAYASPDGTVYVESGLAQLAGESAGLWAAILSHEMAHVVLRDWARRYLYQKSLESGSGTAIVLGDPGLPSNSWTDSRKASADLAIFCRGLEIGADREGLMWMARAGYHPDFVPALHHLLHALDPGAKAASLYAMHPCWEQRDRDLSRAYVEASIEFEHHWPEWYNSPGGNPPVLVFADEPTVKKTGSKEWEIRIPMRCQNLAGAVEVVLREGSAAPAKATGQPEFDSVQSDFEASQVTGCTSPQTTITFTLENSSGPLKPGRSWTDVYVLDSWGQVLARADLPKLPR